MKPVEFKVTIKMDKVERKVGSIIIPDSITDVQQVQQDTGEVIAMGGRACEDFKDPMPEVGDRVTVSRHSGFIFHEGTGKDKETFKVVNDKDITMVEKRNG